MFYIETSLIDALGNHVFVSRVEVDDVLFARFFGSVSCKGEKK